MWKEGVGGEYQCEAWNQVPDHAVLSAGGREGIGVEGMKRSTMCDAEFEGGRF